MHVPHIVLVLLHSCAMLSRPWDTKLRWLLNKVVGIRTFFVEGVCFFGDEATTP